MAGWTRVWMGMGSLFSVTHSPLYRYPYRLNEEGLRGDWHRVVADITSVVQPDDAMTGYDDE